MSAGAATAVIPIKRFARAKSRLAGTFAAAQRPALAEAMLTDVLAALADSRALARVIVVTGEGAAAAIARDAGAEVVNDPDDAGHSAAALLGVYRAIELGAGVVILLPGDCPLLAACEIDVELRRHEGGLAVIPDRHGAGTNGLILAPPDAIEPSFGPGSRDRHLELARAAGVPSRIAEIPSLALDLDTADDLENLGEVLASSPEQAPVTAAALTLLSEPL